MQLAIVPCIIFASLGLFQPDGILLPQETALTTATTETPRTPETLESPESLLEKSILAIGGTRALNEIASFQLHGLIRLADERPVVEIDLSTSGGGKVLGTLTFVGVGQSRFGSDGTTAWEQNFTTDQTLTWGILEQSALTQKVRQINWLEWFTMLPAKINDMEILGDEEFDDESCWKVLIPGEDAQDEIAFFSKETFRPRGRRTVEKTPSGNVTIDVYFREWRRVKNLLLFHSVVFDQDGSEVTFNIDRISIDTLPDSLFALPEQIKALQTSEPSNP